MKRNNFITGAFILSVGGILAKIFSAIYRIGLTRILGGEGIGIYQLIFPFYSLCVVLATAGLPMAISKVIAKYRGSEKQVLKKSIMFVSAVSLVLTAILILSSKGLAHIQGEPSIWICYLILAPTIIIVSLSSVLRGYFQGRQNFTPSALSNIVEQFVKLLLGLTLSFILLRASLLAAIIGAMASIVVSEIISIFVLLICFKNNGLQTGETDIKTKEILKDVLPITISNIILPIASFIDSLIVVNLLNFDRPISIYLYGLESGAVNNLVSLPTIFSFAIASVILPNLSGKQNVFNKSFKLNLAVKIVLIITIPCALCFLLLPNQFIKLLYGARLSAHNLNGLEIASKLLAISSFGVIFLSINQIYSSCLQAVDKRSVTITNLLIAVVVKFAIQVGFLWTNVNIYALAAANTMCYVVCATLNHFSVREIFNLKISNLFFGKIIIANFAMFLTLFVLFNLKLTAITTLLSICLAGLIYLGVLLLVKIYDKKDIAMLKYKKMKTQKNN